MDLDTILADDETRRDEALASALTRPEHERSMLSARLSLVAREAADALEAATTADRKVACATLLGRACRALSLLRLEVAKTALLRLADEGAPAVKAAIARALRGTTAAEGRAVLVHLLSDDEGRDAAIAAIGVAPWPEVLPALIEIAEYDDEAARVAAAPIAKCGAAAGPNERAAAADYLLEQLDDENVLAAALDALLRHGRDFPGVAAKAKRLSKEPGDRKVAALCLVAAFSDEGNANLLELALGGSRLDGAAARTLLAPLLADKEEHIRVAAERTWKALDLGLTAAP